MLHPCNTCHTPVTPCYSLLTPCYTLLHSCNTLIHPCKTQLHLCNTLLHPCNTLSHPWVGWWDLTINDSLMAHFKFLYLLAYFVSVFAFRRWRGWQDQKSCHGFLSISFKLYISELHLDDVYEDFDRTRWNDRNGCFESQTKGVGGRDNNSIIIITTMINPKNCDLDQQKWVKVKWCEWGNWSGQGGHVKYTNNHTDTNIANLPIIMVEIL